MIKSFAILGLSVCIFSCLLSTAQAGPVLRGSLVNGPNTLQDQSIEQFFDQDNDGFVSTGDVIISVLRIDDALPSGAPYNNALYVVASQEVVGTIAQGPALGGGTQYAWSLAPTAIGTVDTVMGGTGNGLDILALTGLLAPVSGSPLAAVFEMAGGFGTNAISADPGDVDFSGVVDIFDFTTFYASGTPDVLAGFDPSNPTDFLSNLTSAIAGPASPIGKGPSVATLTTATTGIQILSFSGGLSVLTNYDPLIIYNRIVGVNDVIGGGLSVHDIGITLGSVTGSAGTSSGAYTPTNRDSQQFLVDVEVVPEPTSVALFGLGGLALAACGYRRRQRGANLAG